jgi:hypothetical protein
MPDVEAVICRIKRLVGGNTDRSHNLKPFLIHHYENTRVWKSLIKATPSYYSKSDPKVWTNILPPCWRLFHILFHVRSKNKKYRRGMKLPFRNLRIVDNAPGHPAHVHDFHLNVKVLFASSNNRAIHRPEDWMIIACLNSCYLRRTFIV